MKLGQNLHWSPKRADTVRSSQANLGLVFSELTTALQENNNNESSTCYVLTVSYLLELSERFQVSCLLQCGVRTARFSCR